MIDGRSTLENYIHAEDCLSATDEQFSVGVYRNCAENHEGCCIREASWLPSRLLQIEFIGDEPVLRVVPTSELESCQYIALSHCWGGKSHLALTSSNFSSLTKEI